VSCCQSVIPAIVATFKHGIYISQLKRNFMACTSYLNIRFLPRVTRLLSYM